MAYLIRFEDDAALNPHLVGYKFYSLAQAARSGFWVPPAFAISTEAHRQFLKRRRWPGGLLSEVLAAADELDLQNGISIRSSATSEDLENQSFAGQYRTFLEVVHQADLQVKIEECWNSVDSRAVKSYLKAATHHSHSGELPAMAVVLQKMIHPSTAGVAFGKNPMRPDREEIIIEAVPGLADNLVSGHTSPHRAVIDPNGRLVVTAPGAESVADGGGPTLLRREKWLEIGSLLRNLEGRYRIGPLDIEWAIDHEDRLWLLQSRAITTVAPAETNIPPGVWTRKIADDLWADRLTPFLAHLMIHNASRFDMSKYAKWVGLEVKRPTLAIIDGYLYVNCDNLGKILAMIPRRFRSADLTALLPPEDRQLPDTPALQSLAIFIRGLLLGAVTPGANPLFCLKISGRRQQRLAAKIDRIDRIRSDHIAGAYKKVLAASECMAQIQENNQWPYAFAAVLMWVSRWWMVDRLGGSNAEFFRCLHQGADNVAIRIERQIKEMAQQLLPIDESVLAESTEAIFDQLPPDFKRRFDRFIEQYGCRASQRTLYLKRWAEEPRQVLQLIATLCRERTIGAKSAGFAIQQDRQPNRSVAVVSTITDPSSKTLPKGLTRGLLRLTRSYLDRREDLRFLLDRCLFVLRKALLDLGRMTGLSEGVLFLIPPEIEHVVDGSMDINAAKARIEKRRRQFQQPLPVNAFYIDGRPPDVDEASDRSITGIGTSPGRSAGTARIVDDPTSGSIQKGDILVARATDPGWTPILGVVGGVVVEEGGLLNHCSIVARELGIPAVVGVSGATRRIADGSRITIDGDMGIVFVERPET